MKFICPHCRADFGTDAFRYRQHLTGKFPCRTPETEAQRDARVADEMADAAEVDENPTFSRYERAVFDRMLRTGSTMAEAARAVARLARGRGRAVEKARAQAQATPEAPAATADDAELIDALIEQRGTGSIGAEVALTEEES